MKISLRDKLISPWNMKIQNFLMWFKNGLKAQKLLAQGIWENGLLETMC